MEEATITLAALSTSLLLLFLASLETIRAAEAPQVPAFFVFGDSLVDSGNNKFLQSLSQANHSHNGIDFQGSVATGRFCNGLTVTDVVAQELGLPLAPPYLDPSTNGTAILKGVNYASGGAGVLDETGLYFLQRLPLGKQIEYYGNTRSQIIGLLGQKAASQMLSKSIFCFVIGSNDYLNNYVAPVTATPLMYTPQQFQVRLVSTYKKLLTDAYKLDARKFIIAGAGPIGCIPYQLTVNFQRNSTCAPQPNELVLNFNKALRQTVFDLNRQFPDAKFVYVNTYDTVTTVIKNPGKYGFANSDTACCGTGGPYRGLISCIPSVSVCSNRTEHFFWDPYHTSEAANYVLGKGILEGDQSVVEPINVRQLARL
ncbi:hypothetical protein SELMODRAFT_89823 [Selaginella moellendorffii]|uniref:Uncharacterized protein n=1 Tax=Selaginella moellendorffii TaxID=88036 RepID=D8RBA3_SELML|nr:GDSL esterase/lipase At2g23540 [Selaginella moellendorffii]EFJ30459.1 hypothetical protein SELMODRAFT_89823 [Selaginella moellendorffii]|eukprot:XP_002968205.1 GDSL esterase/lipase At2g23540 [Selaginella moellendorffii]